MATTNIQLSTPSHGSNVDTWDTDPINNNSNALDRCIGGVLSLSATSTTLGTSNAQYAILKFSGTLSANVTCTISSIIKSWTVLNNCSGSFQVMLSCGTGNVIACPPGEPVDVFTDGAGFYFKGLAPVGTYHDFGSSDTPSWISACTIPPYLKCNGSTFNTSVFPALAALLGTGTLPDLRGRSRFMLNDGTNRITTGGSSIDGDTRFSAGGNQTATLTSDNIPLLTTSSASSLTFTSHSRGITSDTGAVVVPVVSASSTGADSAWDASGGFGSCTALVHSHTVGTSSPSAVNKMPPVMISGICMIRSA